MNRKLFAALALLLLPVAALAAEYTPGVLLAMPQEPGALRADSEVARLLESHGFTRIEDLRRDGSALLLRSDRVGIDILAARDELATTGAFRAVSPDWHLEFFVNPNDPMLGNQWYAGSGAAAVGLPTAWDENQGDPGAVIAILDTGVDWSHPDLAGNMWQNPDEIYGNGLDDDGNGWIDDRYGWDCGANDNDPRPEPYLEGGIDVGFHGSHCAGIASAATDNGVGIAGAGWNCSLMALKLVGGGNPFSVAAVTMGFDYAVAESADVISMSFGGSFSDFGFMQALVDDATAAGVICVAAAGNNGNSTQMYPAALENVISVAATNSANQRASFSTYGAWVDMAAPGEHIWSCIMDNYDLDFLTELLFMLTYEYDGVNPYMYSDGTSMACPLVAGVVGLVRSAAPTMGHDDMLQHLQDTGDDVTYDYPCGVKLNAANAVSGILTAVDTAPDMRRLSVHPNPFNPATEIRFVLDAPGHARLTVHDVRGREIARLIDAPRGAGEQVLRWNAQGLPSGVYLAKLELDGEPRSLEKLVLLK